MNKKHNIFFLILVVLLFSSCSSSGSDTPTKGKKNENNKFKKLVTLEALETSGFEHIGQIYFQMLVKNDELYILNNKDFMLVKFSENNFRKAERVFKTRRGQAPKEMIAPASFFIYDEQTIAVLDIGKNSVLFFDLDLNYLKETKVEERIGRMARVGNSFAAQLGSSDDNAVAILDNDFKVVKTIIKSNKKIPFEGFFQPFLNMVHYPGKSLIAHSYWCLPYRKCVVNIHDLDGNIVVKLAWEHSFTLPTSKTFKMGGNLYSFDYARIYGNYYAVKCSYSKSLNDTKTHELLLFDREGTLKFKRNFPYDLLNTAGSLKESHIYFMDDEEGISYFDVAALL